MNRTIIQLSALIAIGASTSVLALAEDLRLEGCVASAVDKVRIAAKKEGVVVALEAREGAYFEAGGLLARLDDEPVRAQQEIVVGQEKIAVEKAGNSVDIRFAEAAAKVAEFEYLAAVEANEKAVGAIARSELKKLELARDKAILAIEQAKHMQHLAELEVVVRTAEKKVVEVDLAQRRVTAPFAGEVTETRVRPGDWVRMGDPMIEMIRLDQLRVEGFADVAKHAPNELVGRRVTAHFELERGRKASLVGKLTFAHPEVDGNGHYRVSADVANVSEQGRWILRPGLTVTMQIHLDEAATAKPVTARVP